MRHRGWAGSGWVPHFTAMLRIGVEGFPSLPSPCGTPKECSMKSHTEYLVFETPKRREMVHITNEVEHIVRRSGVKDGLCFVSPMHITAAVYVNDLEDGLIDDIGKWLEELATAR